MGTKKSRKLSASMSDNTRTLEHYTDESVWNRISRTVVLHNYLRTLWRTTQKSRIQPRLSKLLLRVDWFLLNIYYFICQRTDTKTQLNIIYYTFIEMAFFSQKQIQSTVVKPRRETPEFLNINLNLSFN